MSQGTGTGLEKFLEKIAKHLLTCGALSCIISKSDFDRSVFARLFCEKRTCENIRYYCLFSRRCRKWFVRREDGLRREAVPEELIGSLRRPISWSALSVMSSNFRIQYAVLAVTIRVARSLRWVRIDFLRLLILKLKGCPDCLSCERTEVLLAEDEHRDSFFLVKRKKRGRL